MQKTSPGCRNCFVYKMDQRYGRDTTKIEKGKTTYELKDKACPPNSLVKLCFSSDFFIEEADAWRDGCWDTIRRSDCRFVMTTKRPERIKDCVPADWGDGWGYVYISISIENQEMADIRLKAFLDAPVKHREVFCSPLIGPISLGKYLDTGLIKCVNAGGETAPKKDVRPTEYEWVKNLYLEARERNIEFYFHQSGSMFLKDGKNIGKWNLNEQIRCAEEIQHELERTYG